MIVLDANYILRFLLKDNDAMFNKAKETIEAEPCFILNAVLAEVVYVLSGVYSVPKADIVQALSDFIRLDTMSMYEDKTIFLNALLMFQNTNLNYVDCFLCALGEKFTIKTFNKKLNRCLEKG